MCKVGINVNFWCRSLAAAVPGICRTGCAWSGTGTVGVRVHNAAARRTAEGFRTAERLVDDAAPAARLGGVLLDTDHVA